MYDRTMALPIKIAEFFVRVNLKISFFMSTKDGILKGLVNWYYYEREKGKFDFFVLNSRNMMSFLGNDPIQNGRGSCIVS